MTRSTRTSTRAGLRGRLALRTGCLLLVVGLAGCAAPEVQLAAPVPAPQWVPTADEVASLDSTSAAALSSRALWITVRDARSDRPPRVIGLARTTMGIPREIRQVGEWDLARAIGHGIGTGLQNAGWQASGFDPPDPRLVLPAPAAGASKDSHLGTDLPGWTLRLVVDRLWCDGYFNEYSFAIGLRLHLLDSCGGLRARAEFRQEYVEEYKHPADFAYQVEVKTREALSTLLADLGLANGFPVVDEIFINGRRPPKRLTDADYFYNEYEKSGEDADEDDNAEGEEDQARACPKCERSVAATWKHCPDCGAPLPSSK